MRLSDGQKRLDAAIRTAAPAVWDWDAGNRMFLASEGLRALYGVAASAPFGLEEYISRAHPDDRIVLRRLFEVCDETHLPRKIIYRVSDDIGQYSRWHSVELKFSRAINGQYDITGTLRDVSSERESVRALNESEERLHLAMEAGRLAIYEIDLTSGRLTGSAELNLLYGLPLDATPTLADLRSHYAPGELERLEKEGATYERARDALNVEAGSEPSLTRGRDRRVEAAVTIVTPAGVIKYLDYRAQYVGSRLIGVLVDVSDRKRAEDRLALVAGELHHRLNNTLAIVRVIATQTFRSADGVEESLVAFLARLQALAAATAALLRGDGDEIPLGQIVRLITEPYRSKEHDPFHLSGGSIRVSDKLATSVAMALHELCTNAIKHGSLSRPDGTVSVTWQHSEAGMIELRWQEMGGPVVVPPTRRGFGSRLLSTLIPYGSVDQDFAPDGLVCVIKCRLNLGD